MLIKSNFKILKSPLLIITLILLIANLVQFYFIYYQRQQANSTFFLQSRLNRDQNNTKAIPTYKTNSKKISSNKLKAIQAIIFEATNIKDIEIIPKY